MGPYRVLLPTDAKTYLKEGKDAKIVFAESAAEAKLVCKAHDGLPSDEAWDAASSQEMLHSSNLADWRARISIYDSGAALVEQVEITAISIADFDSIGDLLVTALNLTSSIAGAAYATPNLTVAETPDTLGDHTVVVEFLPPITWDDPTIAFPSFWGTIPHEGAGGHALAVVLNDVVLPHVKFFLGSGH